ncbi:hypothetical protein AAG570_009034 [Ranatra chinensis]|uniref:Uncharacterized protein n=1 Tax=Ranatra chinensis TaxID=642074 RepID=A0ABD0Z9P0_9HEMI
MLSPPPPSLALAYENLCCIFPEQVLDFYAVLYLAFRMSIGIESYLWVELCDLMAYSTGNQNKWEEIVVGKEVKEEGVEEGEEEAMEEGEEEAMEEGEEEVMEEGEEEGMKGVEDGEEEGLKGVEDGEEEGMKEGEEEAMEEVVGEAEEEAEVSGMTTIILHNL